MAVVSIRQISGSCGYCGEVREGCDICSEEIVMWRCSENVEVVCDGSFLVEKERFVPNSGVCI